MRSKIAEIQYLRALAVLLVIIGHTHQAQGQFFGEYLLGDWAFFGFAGVDVFFVISGFIIHALYGERRLRPVQFILHRFNRIFPLYWFVTAVAMAGSLLLLGNELSSVVDRLDVGTVLLWPTGELPYLAVGWTLTHELYFYAAYIGFLSLPDRVRWWVAGVWAASGLILHAVSMTPDMPLLRLMFSPFNLLFFAGVSIVPLMRRQISARWRILAVAVTLVGGAIAIAYTASHGLAGLADPVIRVGVFAPFAVGVVLLALELKPRLPQFAAWFGDWSYSAYLIHSLVVTTLALLLAPRIGHLPGDGVLFFLAAITASVGASAILHLMIEQPALKWGKRLVDGGLSAIRSEDVNDKKAEE